MKKKTKVIVSSALTMALSASLIAGSTYALFASRANVNVAITSGSVDVVATVNTDSLKGYSTLWDDTAMDYVQKPVTDLGKEDGNFYAGGSYSYAEGALNLIGIAPGDAVEFELNIENKSTLAIQYRVQLTVPTTVDGKEAQGDIVKELEVSFNGEEPVTIGDESTFAQPWSDVIEKGAAIDETPKVKVELPYELEDEFQNQSCLLHVGVYAVQLGTHTAETYGTYNIYTGSDFLKLVNGNKYQVSSFKGETIALMNDIDLDPNAEDVSTLSLALADAPMPIAAVQSELNWDSEFQGTLDGNGFTISNFKSVELPMGMGADMPKGFINTTRNATIRNLIISDAAISFNSQNVGTSNRYKYNQGGTLVGVAYGTLTVENVVIKNSTVKSTTNYTNKCTGAGGKTVKTKEEALQDNPTWNSYPLVGYDVIGALIGVVYGDTTISNVKVTLNETSAELTGAEQIKDYKEEVLRQFKGNKLIGEINGTVTYVGNTTLDCISEDGMDENMIFNTENGGVSEPSLLVKSAEALASLSQSEKDYTDVTIKLAEDIVVHEGDLDEAATFSGTIEGNGNTISGLDLGNAEFFSGANVQNANLEFTTKLSGVTVENPDGELKSIATNYKNTTVTVANGDASYTVTYGETAGTATAVAFNGNKFEGLQTLANDIVYSFDGVTFASLDGTANKAVTLKGSTFGTAFEAVILADVSPVLDATFAEGSILSGNTFHGDVTLNGTATLKDNTMSGALTLGGSVTLIKNTLTTVTIEAGAKVLFTADNTIGGKPVSYQEDWSSYDFVGWDVVLNDSNQIVSGTFALGESGQDALAGLLADDADILYYDPNTNLLKNAKGKYAIDSAEALMNLNAYVESQESISERLDIILTNNIDLTGIDFSSWATMTKKFDGSIDGNGKVVYGMSGIKNVYYDFILKTIFGSLNDQTTNSVKNITFLFPYGTLNSGAPYTQSVTKITLTNVLSVHINAKKQFDFLYYYQATTGGKKTVGTTSTPVIEDTRLSEYGIPSLQQLFAEKLGAEIWNGLIV